MCAVNIIIYRYTIVLYSTLEHFFTRFLLERLLVSVVSSHKRRHDDQQTADDDAPPTKKSSLDHVKVQILQ